MLLRERFSVTGRAIVFAVLISTSLSLGSAQQLGQPGSSVPPSVLRQPTGGIPSAANSGFDVPPSPFHDSTKQKMNGERQKRLVSDSQRLLVLANQLKAEVASSGGEAVTPEMLHQMDEIEKLARSVKDKMRD